MVGEVYVLDTARVATFTAPNLLHLAFHFPPLWSPWNAEAWRYQLDATYREVGAAGGWPTWVLSNHDCPRHRSRYGSEARARAAAVLLLTQRGTPFLYAGEELGLQNAVIPPERAVDPGGRDVCRAPIPWDATPAHGWSERALVTLAAGTGALQRRHAARGSDIHRPSLPASAEGPP